MGSIGRSIRLIGQSWKVLMKDKELLLLPLLSGICIVIVSASFVIPMGLADTEKLETLEDSELAIPAFLFYVVTYTISFFFQAAIIAGASQRMAGGDPTLGSALGAASKRFGPLLMWGAIAATVGMILRIIQDRSEIVGKIIVGLIGVAWSLATFFMVPVLVMEEESVGTSFKRSWAIFKKTWGETVVGSMGIGLLGLLGFLVIGVIAFLIAQTGLVVTAIVTAVIGFILLMLVMSALQGVYVAAMYRYATIGAEVETGFDNDLLASAYRPKKRK